MNLDRLIYLPLLRAAEFHRKLLHLVWHDLASQGGHVCVVRELFHEHAEDCGNAAGVFNLEERGALFANKNLREVQVYLFQLAFRLVYHPHALQCLVLAVCNL